MQTPLASQFETRKGESPVGGGPLRATGAARADLGGARKAQSQPEAEVTSQSGSSSPDAAEPKTGAKETKTEPGAGSDKPQVPIIGFSRSAQSRMVSQDRRPAPKQQENSTASTDLRSGAQCNVELCAATYKSFRAADCTYQPHGGGPRQMCELSARSADARPQTSRAETGASTEAKDTQARESRDEVPKSTTPARAGAQCHVNPCAATYASFRAADCTYQPYDGGPRRICER